MRLPIWLAVLALSLSVAVLVQADCRGCCSRHGGVTCIDGRTQCRNGRSLSAKCRQKGCDKCGVSSSSTTRTSSRSTSSTHKQSTSSKYNRKDWPHWIDEDRDCQDTRAEILIRDNTGTLTFKTPRRCRVTTGRWVCPYTGKTITKASDVDIDHIVPLSWAHRNGGRQWSRAKKTALANDPKNLLAVDDTANRKKGDKPPGKWMPPRTTFHMVYLRTWGEISATYGLGSAN